MKHKHFTKLLLCSLFYMISKGNLLAQAPSNDECSGAISVATIPYNDLTTSYVNANTNGATRSSPNPSCITSSDNNDDIWYKFVAGTKTELLRVHSAVAGNSYVAFGYALYDGCGGTEIACNNYMGSFYGNEMLGGLTPGNTYYLRFWSQYNFTYMTFSFAIMDIVPVAPGNDPTNAIVLDINDPGAKCIAPQFFTTEGATRSSPDPSCNTDNDDDVWFQFTCPANAVNIYPEEGALISSGGFANLGMEIIDATAGISVSCVQNFGVGSTSSLSGIAGHVYQIRIWTMGTGDHAVFSLCLQQGYNVYPANNTCATATNLVVGGGSCTNSVVGNLANSDVTVTLNSNPSCTVNTTLKNDVWYKATVPSSGNIVVQTSATHSAVNDLVLLAYTTDCTTFTQIDCDEDGNPDPFPSANHSRISLTGRTPGEIIYFRVLPRNGNNMGQFSICTYDETASTTPSITIDNVKQNEGNSGTKQFDFTVSLSAASTSTISVKYKTVDVTATSGVDYVAVPTKTLLTFNPGETSKKVSITVNGDVDVESNETFKVKLSNPLNATIADNTGKGTIKNDDGPVASAVSSSERITYNKTDTKILVYPNPVTDKLTIDLPLTGHVYKITMTDITGRTIRSFKTAPDQKTTSIIMNTLSKGVYFISIASENTNGNFKVVKQ